MDTTHRTPGQEPHANAYGTDGASEAAAPGEPAAHETPTYEAPTYEAPVYEGNQHWATGTFAAEAPAPPTAPPPAAPGHARGKGRKRRGVALVVAAALAAGLVGGAAGGLIGNAVDDSPAAVSVSADSGTTPVQSASDQSLTGVSAVADAVLPSVVEITVQTRRGSGTGSGLILSEDGRILTNAHVVADSDGGTITVTFSDGRTATATVVGSDSASDLAVIEAENVSGLKPASLGDSDTVAVGDTVVAIGSPEGLTGTVTSGIVSALNRDVEVPSSEGSQNTSPFSPYGSAASTAQTTTYKAIQTDASINPGNSGGPLLDMNGQVIGINSAIYSPTSGALGTEAGSVGLGFAIPINQVKTLLADLESGTSA
ncbi:S1C family serine protease [Yinghuangia sp. YIM S10712]|uniref:S1C family serine protease n=1 Tax=Yinghuangia sp. YIM S10712 TaxID=3436930 RepID=UPI003F53C1A2